ncbi:MAG TPA: glycoside hydrolase family 88 protein [Thermoanaerobaculia bacterium]|nr:glycoside hydrolase family 88 protein [Thermoanaerobaculia bacterium]
MPRFPRFVLWFLVLTLPAVAAPKRRAVQHPGALTREHILETSTRVADRVTWTFHPRLHWENAVYFDGLVLLGEQMESRAPGSGARFLDRAAAVILDSDDPIETVYWGDGTAFAQATLDLYRVLPPSDPRRAALLTKLAGPMSFAEHAIRVRPADGAPRNPWWIEGGYGARFWQDDLYMVTPWLALYGASGNELARNLAYEWIESYVYEHRPESTDAREAAVPSLRSRRGTLLWDAQRGLFHHAPGSSPEFFWARGNGWALVALARAAEALDAPYTGGRYDQVVSSAEMREMLRIAAQSLIARRTPDGGWSSYLAMPDQCPEAETSGTALLTFFLARGVNEGWLDRATYAPIATRALALLLRRVDAQGVVYGIQPPDVGPGCGKIASDNAINVNYGPGALLLAASEVLKFADEDLR